MPEPLSPSDERHLTRAIELADGGRGRVSPNPLVGAVLTRGGEVVGEGFHTAFGAPHAEVEAIRAAGANGADGAPATLYVSLEPCCHQGQTPPCTEAIVAAGIDRVVVASDDPSDKAAGRGLGILRDEGIDVTVADGELAARARLINQPFRKHARTGRPLVLFKAAMSLDGKVATETGDSRWISGSASRRLVHRWRAEFDAVAVGIGTALADDPRLTARDLPRLRSTGEAGAGEAGEWSQPRRVVFDSTARLPLSSKLVEEASETPLTVVVSRAARRTAISRLENAGVEIVVATGGNEPARVENALDQLGAAAVGSVLLEGGPRLAGAFLDAGEIDELRLFIAPIVVGGRRARDPLEGAGAERIAHAARALELECTRIEQDVLLSARMREW